MKLRLNPAVQMLAMLAAMGVATGAAAQSAGEWTIKAGANRLMPKVESGDVSPPALPHTKASVGDATGPTVVIDYGLTDNITLELPIGLPFKHELSGDGAIAGTGKLGTAEALPATLLAQYRFFSPKDMVRPYVGVGATYAYFMKETGSGQLTAVINAGGPPTTYKIDNKLAATIQAGVSVKFNERWFADVMVTKTYLETGVTYSTGQTQRIKFDPVSVGMYVGYAF
ncbi:MAG: OmpW family outer membrane protein [Pseudomonadota bacterium]